MIEIEDHGGPYGGGGGANPLSTWGIENFIVDTGQVISEAQPVDVVSMGKIKRANTFTSIQTSTQATHTTSMSTNNSHRIVRLDNTHALVVYIVSGGQPWAQVITYSAIGNSYSVSAAVAIGTAMTSGPLHICVLSATKVIVLFNLSGYPYDGQAVVVNIVGNAIGTTGSNRIFNAGSTTGAITSARISDTSALVFFRNNNANSQACVMTVSGNTITVNTIYAGPAENIDFTSMAKIDDTRYVATYKGTSNNYMKSVIISVSGTVVSFGTPLTWYSSTNGWDTDTLVIDSTRILVNSNNTQMAILTYSGTTLTLAQSQATYSSGISSQSMPATLSLIDKNTVLLGWHYGNGGAGIYTKVINLNGNAFVANTASTLNIINITSNSGVCAYLGSGIYVGLVAMSTNIYSRIAVINPKFDGIAKTGGTAGQTIQVQTF